MLEAICRVVSVCFLDRLGNRLWRRSSLTDQCVLQSTTFPQRTSLLNSESPLPDGEICSVASEAWFASAFSFGEATIAKPFLPISPARAASLIVAFSARRSVL